MATSNESVEAMEQEIANLRKRVAELEAKLVVLKQEEKSSAAKEAVLEDKERVEKRQRQAEENTTETTITMESIDREYTEELIKRIQKEAEDDYEADCKTGCEPSDLWIDFEKEYSPYTLGSILRPPDLKLMKPFVACYYEKVSRNRSRFAEQVYSIAHTFDELRCFLDGKPIERMLHSPVSYHDMGLSDYWERTQKKARKNKREDKESKGVSDEAMERLLSEAHRSPEDFRRKLEEL